LQREVSSCNLPVEDVRKSKTSVLRPEIMT
jgi:hypothetical protein